MTTKTTIKCPRCGYENREDAQFCQSCGAPITSNVPTDSTKPLPKKDTAPLPKTNALPPTRPLPGASTAFAPLPEGALLHNGRYAIVELISTSEQQNIYQTEDITLTRQCPVCQIEINDPQERFCDTCGADLSGVEPHHAHYLIQESIDGQAFAPEAQLLKMHLEHPALRLPREYFIESPYGPPRHYLVKPKNQPPLASSLSIPQELSLVLEWGMSLAQALDYLHRHHVTLRDANLKQIAIQGKSAQWAHLNTASVIAPSSRTMTESYFTQDVQGLATLLTYLATGHQSPQQLPDQVAATFSRALADPPAYTAAEFAQALEYTLQELTSPEDLVLIVGHRTDVGRERSLNEDSLLVMDMASADPSTSTPISLFVIADGMGGHAAGDVASHLAVQAVEQQALDNLSPADEGNAYLDARQWIENTVRMANQSVYEQRQIAGTDMGTTLILALVVGNVATIANVGDSRAYLMQKNGIIQVTTDHSLVERLIATGQITREEANHHPQRNVIYRVIGDKPDTEVDIFRQQLIAGQALLLCSDGLSGMVREEQIWHIWSTADSPQEACNRLVEAANQAGGTDNITVIIAQLGR